MNRPRTVARAKGSWSVGMEISAVLGRTFTCFVLLLLAIPAIAQQGQAPAPSGAGATTDPSAESLQAADEVLATMSSLLSLPILHPIKKSVRTREQIRQYLEAEEKKDRDEAKDYADQKALEKFGLIPKG